MLRAKGGLLRQIPEPVMLDIIEHIAICEGCTKIHNQRHAEQAVIYHLSSVMDESSKWNESQQRRLVGDKISAYYEGQKK